jgi:hypothetical protein
LLYDLDARPTVLWFHSPFIRYGLNSNIRPEWMCRRFSALAVQFVLIRRLPASKGSIFIVTSILASCCSGRGPVADNWCSFPDASRVLLISPFFVSDARRERVLWINSARSGSGSARNCGRITARYMPRANRGWLSNIFK